jgi:hypothetical protein
MSENVQPLITFNAQGRTFYPGLDVLGFDAQFGSGNFSNIISFNDIQWVRIRHSAAGDDAFVNVLGAHPFVHPILDPLIPLPYQIRLTETIQVDFGAATQGRIFFGFGEWVDVTADDSLRGLGFYCDETGNWFALLSDALGDRVRVDTGVSTAAAHFFRVELDGVLKEVRWYVDEVLITSHLVATPLDQIASGTDLQFYDVGVRSTGEQIDAYIAAGALAQMSFITNEPEAGGANPWTPGCGCS